MMAEAWPPSVGARVRPVETAQVAFSPDGQPLPTSGPAWARLRWPLPSDGDDRREALVADVEDGETGRGGSANTSHARASLVWNDGSEQDDVSLALLGPCVDGQRQGSAEAATVVVRNEDEENEENDENVGDAPRLVESARRVAAASDARGAFRFRRGDFAAAAAEYVETCASLLSVVPRKHARLVLPGDEKEWNLPRRRRRWRRRRRLDAPEKEGSSPFRFRGARAGRASSARRSGATRTSRRTPPRRPRNRLAGTETRPGRRKPPRRAARTRLFRARLRLFRLRLGFRFRHRRRPPDEDRDPRARRRRTARGTRARCRLVRIRRSTRGSRARDS